jgi:DNA-binding CsgD family transcriptional regulator
MRERARAEALQERPAVPRAPVDHERAGTCSLRKVDVPEVPSPGEHEVAILVAQGLTNAQVAERLGISPFTVDGRLRRVFTKLAVSNRVELASEYLAERS